MQFYQEIILDDWETIYFFGGICVILNSNRKKEGDKAMSQSCNHDCGSCAEKCSQQTMDKSQFLAPLHPQSKVKKVIGIVSGKGGVGKSLVTSLMAVKMNNRNHKVGILDGDITGPSIPKAFGLHDPLMATKEGIMIPATTATGIDIVSTNLILPDETDPVIWRGSIISGVIKQFWSEAIWKDIEYMFVDMPPGTGDVPLTVYQSLPVDGIIIVASPQELVSMIVAKAVKMAQKMEIPILGLVENMSYIACPDCGKKMRVFGESHIHEIAKQYGLPVLAEIPIDPKIVEMVDEGAIEFFEEDWLDEAAKVLEAL